ncbi:Fur family transcriptional regulator, zinc uptake regulator [Pilibacter termitis]|uniref:Fur family transcriptional regulator, zinc uptake regulator n=1 Tax=Pilibacter termitis TaxID=263852 RepID=A0A1T4MYF9_9ENTE|nr:Fur family transcriptional regulator [Pilibacter termitis]SJZ71886.1 Fur family transcriptional regulator, zinc uptake regulator [Pilibacter termitis]
MTEINKVNIALENIKSSGLKYTKKREELLKCLNQENHYVSAKEVHQMMKKTFPNISLDTIYRNLQEGEELGVLERVDFKGKRHYRINCELGVVVPHHHHHFICTGCGEIQEIDFCPIEEMVQSLGAVKVEGHQVEIFGKCEKCVEENKKN